MVSKVGEKEKRNIEDKISSTKLLSSMFSYIPLKRAVEILKVNKKLSFSLNLTIEEYILDRKFREIVDKSKGNLNYVFENTYIPYQKEMLSPTDFGAFTKKIIKYLKYSIH